MGTVVAFPKGHYGAAFAKAKAGHDLRDALPPTLQHVLDADRVLAAASDEVLTEVIVIGRRVDGSPYVASSTGDFSRAADMLADGERFLRRGK